MFLHEFKCTKIAHLNFSLNDLMLQLRNGAKRHRTGSNSSEGAQPSKRLPLNDVSNVVSEASEPPVKTKLSNASRECERISTSEPQPGCSKNSKPFAPTPKLREKRSTHVKSNLDEWQHLNDDSDLSSDIEMAHDTSEDWYQTVSIW